MKTRKRKDTNKKVRKEERELGIVLVEDEETWKTRKRKRRRNGKN